MRRSIPRVSRAVSLILFLAATLAATARAQNKGDDEAFLDDGQDMLQSLAVPSIQHAPFSLTLATEWTRPLKNGGVYTMVNSWPMKRDSLGRIYEERWPLAPKDARVQSELILIQIADPVARTYYECNPPSRICELYVWTGADLDPIHPELLQSGRLKSGKGFLKHEDLGKQSFAGVSVHQYRDTTTLDRGTIYRDQPLSYVRSYRFSEELGFNLTSTVDTPKFGQQSFTVTELSTTEPDPKFFLPPEGYTVVDHRKSPDSKPD